MSFQSVIRLLYVAASLTLLTAITQPISAKPSRTMGHGEQPSSAIIGVTLNLSDFGATGDGVTDDGPAFQRALDALALAGGGTLFVPAGRYLVSTPVVKDFSAVNDASVKIQGVPSSTMPAPPTAPGNELMLGLALTSEIVPATGSNHRAFNLTHLRELSFEHLVFLGRPQEATDALITLYLANIDKATIHHCEFYGLSSLAGGNIVRADKSELTIELSVFLGCTANSGAYGAVVENLYWRKFVITNSIFLDYGSRPNFFSKTGLGAPLSWIDIGNADATTPESPRREFVVRDTFLDEGGWVGISAFPYRWGPTARIDLLYISGLKANAPNLETTSHLLYDITNVMIENSHYGWSHNAYAAIDINRVGTAIFDNLTCIDHADRLRADSETGRLTVINSVYAGIDSQAQITNVVNTTPEEDPVQYVRRQFLSTLGRQPDPAAHFYWSDLLVRCGDSNDCLAEKRLALNQYLGQNPQAEFSINGTVVDLAGQRLSNAAVSLTGSQTSATTTDSEGRFLFARLPTSGSYTVAVNKQPYNFASQSFIHPATDTSVVFQARVVHSIAGRITRANGNGVSGVSVQLSQAPATSVTSDANGYYSFPELPAGQSYTIVPTSPDLEFTPASTTFQNLSANQTANFTGNLTKVSIAGTVVDEADVPLSGVTVNLTGSQSATLTTNAQGNFNLPNLPTSGTYTVAVSKQHYTFAPASHSFLRPNDNVTVSFEGQLNRHSIAGRITRANGTGFSGVTVQLSQGQASATSVISDANGYYSFPGLPAGQGYTVVPSLADFGFTPANTSFQNLSSNQTANFTGHITTVSIAGTVLDEGDDPLSGVTVNLTGSQSATLTTDAQGNFNFPNLPTSGTYTVAVSKQHYTFAPATQSFTRPVNNVTISFKGQLNRHSIAGRITRANGTGVSGVTVKWGQAPAATVSTNASGYYSFPELPAGQSYTIVPTSPDLEFTPASTTFQNLSANQTANFTGNPTKVSIAGTVVDEGDDPLSGVTVHLTGSQSATLTTDAQGNFNFPNLPTSGTYTVAVSRQHYTFTHSSRSFNRPNDNVTVSFEGELNRHSIAGRITRANGTGVSGVTVKWGQEPAATASTDANGYYSFSELPAGQTYTVVPTSLDLEFTPASTSFQNLSSNQTANFTGNLINVSIAGTVVDEVDGPLGGVTVNLTGSQSASLTTDAQGNFNFPKLATSGSYTVAVTRNHYSFAPASQSFTRPMNNVTVEFQGRLNRHSINGRITRSDGTGVSGLTVQIAQASTAPVVTDIDGYYSFLQVPAGQSYTVVPSSTEFVFTPLNTTFDDLSTSQTVNFVGKLKPRLLTIDGSDVAVALDSISFISQPFSIISSLGLSGDGLTRLAVFATNVEPNTTLSDISVVAQDDEGHLYPLEIEYLGDVPGQIWLKQLNIKLSQSMPSGKCTKMRITVGGVVSNDARICIAGAGSSSSLAK